MHCFSVCLSLSHSQKHILLCNRWILCFIFSVSFFFVLRAALAAHGRSQARDPIRAAAASLHHSHSNSGPKPHLRPTPQLTATPVLNKQGQRSNPCPYGYQLGSLLLSHNGNSSNGFFQYFMLQSSFHKKQKNRSLRGLFLETVIKKGAYSYVLFLPLSVSMCVISVTMAKFIVSNFWDESFCKPLCSILQIHYNQPQAFPEPVSPKRSFSGESVICLSHCRGLAVCLYLWLFRSMTLCCLKISHTHAHYPFLQTNKQNIYFQLKGNYFFF